MKRPVIIVFSALCAIWLLILPLLVGTYLRGAVPEWTANWPAPEAARLDPGWFQSRLSWRSDDGIELALRARHAPPLRPGLLRLDGLINSPVTPEPARISGHVGLTGGWNLRASITRLQDPGSLALEASDVTLNLAQPAGQPLTLILNAARLGPDRTPGNAPLGPVRLMARQHRDDGGRHHVGIDLKLSDESLGQAGMTLSVGPAEPSVLAELLENLAQWAGSEPDSLTQRLAMLGAASAWQQLATGGLVIRIERLELGEQTRLTARWAAGQSLPELEGGGRIEALTGWYQALAAVAGQAPERAELTVHAALLTLAQNGWIRLDNETFEVTLPARSDNPA